MRFHPGLLIGVTLLLIGLALVIKALFGVHFPILRTIVALGLLYAGIRILLARGSDTTSSIHQEVVFSEALFTSLPAEFTKFQVFFGKAVFDFTALPVPELGRVYHMQVTTVFGGVFFVLPGHLPAEINYNLTFAGGQTPVPEHTFMGSRTIRLGAESGVEPQIRIDIDVVFGGLHIEHRQHA